ncbi:hypothetical protein SPRG_15642 [Saprolegnia parasitica CBS 223.65]|uniref:TauD/TfdA-like domain-containing protein n=1 Tax=Saprolegnia parasitica (strain CBS 223.65) TaxID=695850 RepID=A0A067BL87_SAPPC|nr:hypothetical protein SPRG_15642 [Saprolegnia parasitica CBS 223.65]KDO19199.1 hypothetical protein SPRG_15642 [Saprolegnia parasitica CBS 223.65]|eukprot:XP_012210099.1 hypothetical protein SPRG_15642 [Saprolegnia parasitica CBS 223.65]
MVTLHKRFTYMLQYCNKVTTNLRTMYYSSRSSRYTNCKSTTPSVDVTQDMIVQRVLKSLTPLLHQLPTDRFDAEGRAKVEAIVRRAIDAKQPITFVIPAFPFKSPNTTEKTLGVLPDRGEELAMERLETLCQEIERLYPIGVQMVIFSDGRIFNDIIGVSTDAMDAYMAELEAMAVAAKHSHIKFDRLEHYTTSEDPNQELLERYNCDKIDMKKLLKDDAGVLATYRGFRRFLTKDLAHKWVGMSNSAIDKAAGAAAKLMIQRNMAFSTLVDDCYPDAVRLSIHAYDNAGPKYGVALIPQLESSNGSIPTTPWHCVMVTDMHGREFSAKHEDIDLELYELQYKFGRPWCYMAKVELAPEWATLNISVSPWRQGVTLTSQNNEMVSVTAVPRHLLRTLATKYSVVLLRGFRTDEDLDTVASHIGEILMWPTGSTLELKQDGAAGLASRSHEPMAFHYDGMFKRIPDSDILGDVPLYQFFQCLAPYPERDSPFGRTMFVDTRRLLAALPPTDVARLRTLKMTATTAANVMYGSATLTHHMDLVCQHPVDGQEILRFHEPWDADKTNLQPTQIAIRSKNEAATEADHAIEQAWVFETLVPLLYSDEFKYAHEWQAGDYVLSDNVAQLHSRTPVPKAGREIRRIHVN